jgi:hypothetical protein
MAPRVTHSDASGPRVRTRSGASFLEPEEDEWVLNRDPEPETAEGPRPAEATCFEIGEDFGPRDVPLVWPAGSREAPHMPRQFKRGITRAGRSAEPGRHRVIRPALWAAVAGVAVLGSALAMYTGYTGRRGVMRAFPVTVRIYAALGIAGRPAAAMSDRNTAPLPAGCFERPRLRPERPPDGQTAGCMDSRTDVPAK